MAKRGELTPALRRKMEAFLGRETSQTELRLLPYIQYAMVNNRRLDPNKLNGAERQILSKWRARGHIEGGAGGMAITREFWNFMNDILFDAYVGYDNG